MKAYIQLGTTGRSVFDVKEELERKIKKKIEMKTIDKARFSSTTFEWIVKNHKEAKQDIDKAFSYLTKQKWYFDDKAVSFSTSGLLDGVIGIDDGEWYCEKCGEDVNKCECAIDEHR